ncbi:MAG: L,D-transpeptidase family protein [Gemmobacter sp.]|uniref:L,D-transpeptidase family protein n=1 Tax=Gemmobacter sp. TaxID=1898957 RepID=UPI001A61C1F0|nr:L,D-transpeptidase family protein [Gemmobacter sp.]MBL8561023.1 L,D-transpeptidase family protein [Gemmobacter sp.]
MKKRQRGAGLFSALALLGLIGAAVLLWLPPQPLPHPPATALQGPVDHILIEKAARRMVVFRDGKPLKTYTIALGFAPQGDKLRQGDGRTPEGRFRINRRNAASAYHLSLGLDYPQAEDISRARAAGHDPGGDIFIHGQPNSRKGQATLRQDWTAGCIAVSDTEIEELWAATPNGTSVEIRP